MLGEVATDREERVDELRDMVEGLKAFLSFLVMEGLLPSPFSSVDSSVAVGTEDEELSRDTSPEAARVCCERRCSILLRITVFEAPRFVLSFAVRIVVSSGEYTV